MTPEKEEALCKKHKKIFKENWGFECGDGWFALIDTLCNSIQSHINWRMQHISDEELEDLQVVATQVKEKFGTLRFYFDTEFNYETVQHKIMESIICYAEEKSARTCEVCGTNEYGKTVKNRQVGYWYKTECLECAKERGYEEDIPEEEW